jgi:hypothetical protein
MHFNSPQRRRRLLMNRNFLSGIWVSWFWSSSFANGIFRPWWWLPGLSADLSFRLWVLLVYWWQPQVRYSEEHLDCLDKSGCLRCFCSSVSLFGTNCAHIFMEAPSFCDQHLCISRWRKTPASWSFLKIFTHTSLNILIRSDTLLRLEASSPQTVSLQHFVSFWKELICFPFIRDWQHSKRRVEQFFYWRMLSSEVWRRVGLL